MNNKEFTMECAHCGNKTTLEVKDTYVQNDEIEFWDGDSRKIENYFHVAQCKTCEGISLFGDCELDGEPGNLAEAARLYPESKNFKGIPEAIWDSYTEAKKVEKRSPTAFAVLIRRALEYICKDKGAVGRDLKKQIEDLAQKEIIPKTLARMADALRYFGNIGAHSTDIKIGFQEAKMMDEFFIATVEYVYIAPTKLDALEKSLKKVVSKK